MKPAHLCPILFIAVLSSGAALAGTESPHPDQAVTISGVETVCTGGSANARAEPQWKGYTTRLEFAARNGDYLGGESVTIKGDGKTIAVHCAGPWLLMDLPKGTYDLHASVAGWSRKSLTFHAPARVVIDFKRLGASKNA